MVAREINRSLSLTRGIVVIVEELQRAVTAHFQFEFRQVKVDHRVVWVELVHLVLRLELVKHGILLASVCRIRFPCTKDIISWDRIKSEICAE